jgi:hypothetical protein
LIVFRTNVFRTIVNRTIVNRTMAPGQRSRAEAAAGRGFLPAASMATK